MPTLDSDDDNSDGGILSTISVDVLPFAGKWDASSITFDNRLDASMSVSAGSFSLLEGIPYTDSVFNRLKQVHELDVTEGLQQLPSFITSISFKIYSEDLQRGRIDFASSEWPGGFAKPELLIQLSNSNHPTKSPSTLPPTIAPTPLSSAAASLSTLSVTNESDCVANCDISASEKLQREFGFNSIDEWIESCIDTTWLCREDELGGCKEKCKQDAEKAEEKAMEKFEKHLTKCKERCLSEDENV